MPFLESTWPPLDHGKELWVPILVSTQAHVIMGILGLQKVFYLIVGGLNLVHRSYIGLITDQFVHKTWAL